MKNIDINKIMIFKGISDYLQLMMHSDKYLNIYSD